jgi:hypothetical protein
MYGDKQKSNRDVHTKQLLILIQMYVCMYVCMMYVCMYIYIYIYIYIRLYGLLLEDDDLSLKRVNGFVFMDKL